MKPNYLIASVVSGILLCTPTAGTAQQLAEPLTSSSAGTMVQPGTAAPVLTLEQAIAIARDHNHRITAARARQQAADARRDDARAQRLPRLQLSANYTRTTNPVLVFGNLLRQGRFGPDNFALDLLNHPDPLGNWNGTLSLFQPIWTGGAIGAGIRAADAGLTAAEHQAERTRQQVQHQVIDAYSAAVLARYQLNVAREVLHTAQAHVKLVKDLFEGGVALQADVLQARLRASETEEMVLRAEGAVQVSEAALNLALGRDQNTPIRLPDALELTEQVQRQTPDLQSLIGRARKDRADLLAAAARVTAADSMIDVVHAGSLPQFGLLGSTEANGNDLFGNYSSNWTVMLGGRWTVFDGARNRARSAEAQAGARQARAMHQLLADSVELEVRQAYTDLQTASKRLDASLLAVQMATTSLHTVEDRYRSGLATLVELLDAQTMLTRSHAREISARRDLLVAYASLQLAVGG